MRFFALLVIALLAPGLAVAQTACGQPNDPLRGELGFERRRHENGGTMQGFVLRLPRRACVREGQHTLRFRTVHVVPRDLTVSRRLQGLLNRQVTVRGMGLFGAHTAYHLGDVVLSDAELVSP
jgi:hypothetical protein